MKNKKHSLSLMLTAALMIMVVAGSDAFSQNFQNDGAGTYNAGPAGSGRIRMKNPDGRFNGSTPLGRAAGTRVTGTVEWAISCAAAVINPTGNGAAFYYTNLATSGAADKTYNGNVFVSGTYEPAGGDRNYTANSVLFTYEGPSGTQVVAGENSGANGTGYYALTLSDAAEKQVAAATTVTVANAFLHSNGQFVNDGTITLGNAPSQSDANINNNGTFNSGTGTLALNSTVNNAGTFNGGSGDITAAGVVTNTGTLNGGAGLWTSTADFINDAGAASGGVFVGAGTMQFVDFTNTSGGLDIDANERMQVSGSFTRAAGNFSFDCASIFEYNGAAGQLLLGNTAAEFDSYGNLILSTGSKIGNGNLNICNDFTTDQELDMANGANDFTLSMLGTGTTNSVSYANGVEVRGKFRWATLATGSPLTFNNAQTQITFETVAALTDGFTLDVRQNTQPNLTNYDPVTDVRRKVTASYTGTGKIQALQVMWEATDEVGFNGARNQFRFAEAYGATDDDQLIRFGAQYDRTSVQAANNPRHLIYGGGSGINGIDLIAGAGPGTEYQLGNGSDIMLTTTPLTIVSVTNGRWSNPGTWNTGLIPEAYEDVHLRHLVWTGIDQAVFGGVAWADDERDGSLADDAGAAANAIYIDNVDGASLVIGNQDADMGAAGVERVFRTRYTTGTNMGIFNNNVDPNTGDGDGNNAAGINGIWIRSVGTVFTPVLGTYTLTNAGAVNNRSILEIGVCP